MTNAWQEKLLALGHAIGHDFKELSLLQAAVTHRSIGATNNERLEFLGDAVLNLVIATELFKRFPKAREGDLTRLRATLVREETLAIVARELGVGQYLSLGLGEKKSGGHQKDSILADALEAIIGAIYLDATIEKCTVRILAWYETHLVALVPGVVKKDPKTQLQEYCQAKHIALPKYQLLEIMGDPHHPIFRVECVIVGMVESSIGIANARRKAEQEAAWGILTRLKENSVTRKKQ